METLETTPASPSNNPPDLPGETFAVYNPATGAKLAELPVMPPEQVEQAVRQARLAQQEWAGLSFKERRKIMYRWRSKLIANQARIVETLVSENGKPRPEALIELFYLADVIGSYCANAPRVLKVRAVPLHLLKTKRARVTYHPVGVVGVISPWNFPLLLGFGDGLAALAAGNAIVLKPSEVTPLSALLLAELADGVGFPPDLIQVVTGLGETGASLVDYADLIAFTGGTATGKKVMERASRRLIPVLLELGGKDPMVVLKDADLERAVNGAVAGAFFNTGQTCISVERLFVEAPLYDRFVARLVEQVNKLRLGSDPAGINNIDQGPMTLLSQLELVERQVADARAKGAKILTGGQRRADLPGGLFYEPTVLTGVTPDMLVMQEETFGPLLPVIKVKDAAQALRMANTGRFGLSSSIWTADTSKGEALARQLKAGSTCVNDVLINYFMPEVPFGGINDSGLGYRHGGPDSLKKFCRPQTVVTDRTGWKRELTWLPYSKPLTGLLRLALNLLYRRKY
jgi:acyl-CoA reductase-like NAD-dependent aldehyde dehydrogenase